MLNDKIKEYANKFPFGLKEFTTALSAEISETSLAVIYLLYEKGELTKEEITQQFGDICEPEKDNINASIEKLNGWGIIRRTQTKVIGNDVISKYKINGIYRRMLESCIEILKIKRM